MISNKIKELRIKMNLNLSESSEKIGISPTLLFYLESGRNKPTLETIKKICIAYKVSADWLLDLK